MKAKFRLGRIVATPQALEVLDREDIMTAIDRHQSGDWGEASPEANNQALLNSTRLLSVYHSGVTFWIITEADRSATTVLLPSDY